MKKFQFLLLDAGPIIKLFELGIWDDFLKRCDISISQTVVNEAERNIRKILGLDVNLNSYTVETFDLEPSAYKVFHDKFDLEYKAIIHPGENETLAFLYSSSQNWTVCSADGAVFRALGRLGKVEQGISLEELLQTIGLLQELEWQYTKKFREKYTRLGQIDFIQGKGLI